MQVHCDQNIQKIFNEALYGKLDTTLSRTEVNQVSLILQSVFHIRIRYYLYESGSRPQSYYIFLWYGTIHESVNEFVGFT